MRKLVFKGIFVFVLALVYFNSSAQCPTNRTDLEGGNYTFSIDCGTVAVTGILFSNVTNITIQNGGTLTVQTDNYWVLFGGSTITVESGGTLNVTDAGSDGLSVDQGSLLNVNSGGIVNISSDLDVGDFPGGGNTGFVTANGTLNIGGDLRMNDNATLDGSGTIDITGDYVIDGPGTSDSGFTGSSTCNTGCETLPVELISFQAELTQNKDVLLTWSTASELNNDGFHLEKSLNGSEFDEIGFVHGSGTVNEIRNYEFLDRNVNSYAYYRIRQVDFDGSEEYHPTITFQSTNHQTNVVAIPTLVDYSISLTGQPEIKYRAQLVDLSGKTYDLHQLESLSSIEDRLNEIIPGVNPGVYMLSLQFLGRTQIIKFVKR